MRVCGSGDVRRRRLPCRSDKAAYWQAAPPLGHATTFAAARWRRAHRGPRRGTSSCRYRCRSRRSRYWVSETWRAPCLWRPLPASLAGGAGARPDHPITRLSASPSPILQSSPCAPRNVERRWLPRGWRLVEYAIRTCNRSPTKKRALSLQVRDPHNCDHAPIIERLLFCVLVAGPDKVLLGRKGLSLLLEAKLALGDMADHGIHHRGTGCLRSRLHNDIAH